MRTNSAVRRLFGDTSAATAIEFALIAPVFIALLLSLIEVSIMFFIGAVMEGAVTDAGRQIRTGQAQQSDNPLAAFQDQLCSSSFLVIDCADFTWDVRSFQDFESADLSYNADDSGALLNSTYDPGTARDIVVVRVAYRFDFATPFVQYFFSDTGPSGRLIMATAVFRNEPYTPG